MSTTKCFFCGETTDHTIYGPQICDNCNEVLTEEMIREWKEAIV